MTAQAELFAEAGPVRVAEARAQALRGSGGRGPGIRVAAAGQWQRRTIALVDVAPERFYCLDSLPHLRRRGALVELPRPGGRVHDPGASTWPSRTARWPGRTCPTATPTGSRPTAAATAPTAGAARCSPSPPVQRPARQVGRRMVGRLEAQDRRRPAPATDHGRRAGTEVNICDGRSPAGGSPYEMKWIMLHAKDRRRSRRKCSA